MATRAIQADLLQQRIIENRTSQQTDLATWIFERLNLSPHDRVLELCCGTGGQTLAFTERLRSPGSLVALDASRDALNVLASKLGASAAFTELIEANLDQLGPALERSGKRPPAFDLIFCAYGLYYSSDAKRLLNESLRWLEPGGRIAIVGPYGPNNRQLFELVQASGVTLSEPVLESSERFMLNTVFPWAARNFESVTAHSMVNPVRWTTPERVLNYWQNTTFFDAQARPKFESLLQERFDVHGEFVNEKWVMMLEMRNARS